MGGLIWCPCQNEGGSDLSSPKTSSSGRCFRWRIVCDLRLDRTKMLQAWKSSCNSRGPERWQAAWFRKSTFFPKDVSSQGSSEDCWRISHHTYPTHISHHTYPTHIHHTTHIPHISHTTHIPHISITPHISHTYPFKTYPTNTYPTNTYPFNTYPTSTYPCNAYPFKTFVISRFCNTYPTNTYPFNTYPTNTYPCYAYPFNAYPFKRCASAGIANVSHQCISHQYVSSTRIPPVWVHSMRIHSKSLHQQEWQWVWVSLHIISYHCYSAGMVMNIETLLFLQFFAKLLIEYNCIARVWTWNSLLAIGLPACLPVVCFCACFFNYFLLLYSAGRDGEGQPESNPLTKNASSIAQNCSETQISFSRGQPSRYKRGVDRPKL